MGNPNYEVTKGEVLFDGVNILELKWDERARMDFPAAIIHQKFLGLQMLSFFKKKQLWMLAEEDDEDFSSWIYH